MTLVAACELGDRRRIEVIAVNVGDQDEIRRGQRAEVRLGDGIDVNHLAGMRNCSVA